MGLGLPEEKREQIPQTAEHYWHTVHPRLRYVAYSSTVASGMGK